MFLVLLVLTELAILYAVYWYLFVRDPHEARRIVSGTWGSYGKSATTGGDEPETVKPFMLAQKEEMILDLRTNRYVPLPKSSKPTMASILKQLENCLNELSAKV